MAELYLARAFGVAGFEKRLVIKRIREGMAHDPQFIKLFINEAKISVNLNHPNIVQVYDLGRVGSIWYIAMELLHGRDLNKIVKRLRGEQKKIPLGTAVGIVAETCRGLVYAHGTTNRDEKALGLVHRDVSPHNIILTFTGEVKLVDFGVARLMNTAQAEEQGLGPGRPGGGKYAYMSPEQAAGRHVDHRTDIFSAGILLWELIVGHRLYQDPDPVEKLRCVVEAIVPHPREMGTDIDDTLWAILQKALAKNPDDRYEHASLFEEDLRAWLFQARVYRYRKAISDVARKAFPEEANATSATFDLHRMAKDIERLDPVGEVETIPTPIYTPAPGPNERMHAMTTGDGERKTVTVLIVDIDGVSDLSLRLDPEILFKRHYQILRWLRRIVDRYNGIVQRAIDDQVMILFGVPKTRKDDLARAIECARELCRTVDDLVSKGLHLQLAIGIHSGDVTLGPKSRTVRYVSRGNTTRLPRRLSNSADHGEILVSQVVYDNARVSFSFEPGPRINYRGNRAGKSSYRLTGRKHGLRVAGKGPWLRRGQELDYIKENLMRLAERRGGLVWLTGDVGTGKSRLIKELRSLASKRNVPVYVGGCSSYVEDPPVAPFRDLLSDVLNIEADGDHTVLDQRLKYLAHLGLSQDDIENLRQLMLRHMDKESHGSVDMIWVTLERLLRGLSKDAPVIVALEDTHSLRTSDMKELLDFLVRIHQENPILFLLTRRGPLPESLSQGTSVIALEPFDAAGQSRLIKNLLETEEVEPEVTKLLMRTCEGNPLYLEEMVKYLVQESRIYVENGIAKLGEQQGRSNLPMSLAALISARIDALDPASKGALQLAATIGHTFSANLLGEAMGLDKTEPLMTRLQQHGLVSQLVTENVDQWSFASELVREATQRGILGVQRRNYHQIIASTIESKHANALEPWLSALVRHCSQCDRVLDAARYAFLRGEQLEKQQYLDRARELYKQGLHWINKSPKTPENWEVRIQGEGTLHYRLGTISHLLGNTRSAERHLHLALDIASESGLPWIETRVQMQLGRILMAKGKPALAQAHIQQARSLAQLEQDPELQLEALQAAAYIAHEGGRNEEANRLWSEALESAEGDITAQANCYIGMANQCIRRLELPQAKLYLEQALGLAKQAENKILIGRVLNNLGLLHVWAEEYRLALDCFREALSVREGIGYIMGTMINHHNIGDVHFRCGDTSRAWVSFQRSFEIAKAMGWRRGEALNEVFLGFIEARQESFEVGMERISAATHIAVEISDREISTNGQMLCGRLFIENGQFTKARELLERARECATEHGLLLMKRQIEGLLQTIDENS